MANSNPRSLTLTPQRRALLELLREVPFGTVERLVVRGGEPALEPRPRVIHDVKLDNGNDPRPPRAAADYELKDQVVALFAELDRIGDGVIDALEVKHGLPFRLRFTEAHG